MQARILWIEGKRAEGSEFSEALNKKGFETFIVPSGEAALTQLDEFDPDIVVVHAASLRSSGKRICNAIRAKSNGLPILLITQNSDKVDNLAVNSVLPLPFTIRKLINRITPLLPSEGKKFIHKGPIRLDLETCRVRCQGRETKLTPRLVKILQVLIKNAGSVVERDDLFREVWSTDYVGDTRTLDVHINWLRKAIEEDPKNPRFIKTLRGVGYRLNL
ncbi:MAG: response regulator transcription factor [Anaerolineales bacterium]